MDVTNCGVDATPNVQYSAQNVRIFGGTLQVDRRMVDFLLKKVQNRVSATGIEFNLTPQLGVEVLFNAEKIVFVNVLSHELIGEGAV